MELAPHPRKPFALLFWALNPGARNIAILTATLLGVWTCELAIPFLLGDTVDAAVSRTGGFESILRFGGVALLVSAVLDLLHMAYLRGETRLVARGTFRLRKHLYKRLLDQPLSYFAGRKKAETAHRVMNDTDVLDAHAIYLLADVPFAVLTVLGVFAVMLWMEPVLALLVLGVLGGVAMLSHRVGRPLQTMERSIAHRRARLGGILQESLDVIRAVKTFGREAHETRRLDCASQRLMDSEIKVGAVVARLEPLLQLTETFGFLVVVCYGAMLVFHGALSPGRLVAFIAYMELMREPIRDAASYWMHFRKSAGILARISAFLVQLAPPKTRGYGAADGPLGIDVRGVSYSWPNSPGRVLDNITFSIVPGECVAVVGENGAGKSTLIDLLLGLLEPDEGSIRIGGMLPSDWSPASWHDAVSAVPQETALFPASIEDNIRYGNTDATHADVADAICQSGLSTILAALPHRVGTMIGDRGAKLSGGVRQRIALARALVCKPQLLVLDEPDKSLDAEGAVYASRILRDRGKERTTIVVTHDPATMALTDRVLVLERGRLKCICTPAQFGIGESHVSPATRPAA